MFPSEVSYNIPTFIYKNYSERSSNKILHLHQNLRENGKFFREHFTLRECQKISKSSCVFIRIIKFHLKAKLGKILCNLTHFLLVTNNYGLC